MAPPQGPDTSLAANGYGASIAAAKLKNGAGITNPTQVQTATIPSGGLPQVQKILPDVLHGIGQTPLIRLNRIPQSFGVECEVCKSSLHFIHFFFFKKCRR